VAGDLNRMKFAIQNAAKDMRYYTHLAEEQHVASFLGNTVHQSFELATAMGLGERMVPSMIEAQEKLNQLQIVPRQEERKP
jgi:3-hydroxyisobutyrate dehydrogenase-like beta-hydroxyacid dehydrogenase